nr:threonine--tRNA ligase, mitochondrial 1-like isoform X2 [Tanacetum cinerariifolium]
MFSKSELGLNDDHFDAIVFGAKKAVTEKQPFEIISDLPEDKKITIYRLRRLTGGETKTMRVFREFMVYHIRTKMSKA